MHGAAIPVPMDLFLSKGQAGSTISGLEHKTKVIFKDQSEMSKIVQFLKLTVGLNTNNFIKSSIDTMTQGFIKPKALNPTQVDKGRSC